MDKKTFRNAAISTMAASATVAAVAPAVSAEDVNFPDVIQDGQYSNAHYSDIMSLVDQGAIDGYKNGNFEPFENIDRGQVAKILTKTLDLEVPNNVDKWVADYSDVNENVSYAKDIAAVTKAHVFEGNDDESFNTWTDIDRQQMAKVIVEAFDLDKYDTGDNVDVNPQQVGSTYLPYVQTLANLGITNVPEKFAGTDELQRDQFTSFVVRAQEYVQSIENVDVTANEDGTVTVNGVAPDAVSDGAHVVLKNGDGKVVASEMAKTDKDGSFKLTTDQVEDGNYSYTVMAMHGKDGHGEGNAEMGNVDVNVTPAVDDVSAINATQVKVAFNTEVDETEATKLGHYSLNGQTISDVDLSDDNKTATLTFDEEINVNNEVFDVDPIQTANNANVTTEKYSELLTYEDNERPEVTEVTYPNYKTARVHFSEPVKDLGKAVASDKNASVKSLSKDGYSVDVDLTDVDEGTDVDVTFTGAEDQAGNLMTPNPTTVTAQKTKSDQTAPEVTNMTSNGVKSLTVQFSEKLADKPSINVEGSDANRTRVEKDNDDATKYHVDLGSSAEGVNKVTVSSYKDESDNEGDEYSKLVEFAADDTNPGYNGHKVATINGTQYLVVYYDEAVTSNNDSVTGSYVDGDHVTHSELDFSGNEFKNLGEIYNDYKGNQAVAIQLPTDHPGHYTVTLPDEFVKDASNNTNPSDMKEISFSVGEIENNDTEAPTVNSVDVQTQDDNDSVWVHFDENVTADTALNAANYKVEGESVFKNAIFDESQDTVKLTLKDGVIETNGNRNISIANVKDTAGNVMDAKTVSEDFGENVNPTLESANLTDEKNIQLTFSEAVENGNKKDDDLLVNQSNNSLSVDSVDYNDNAVTLTLESSVDSLDDITVEAQDTIDVQDTNGNDLVDFGKMNVSPEAVTAQ